MSSSTRHTLQSTRTTTSHSLKDHPCEKETSQIRPHGHPLDSLVSALLTLENPNPTFHYIPPEEEEEEEEEEEDWHLSGEHFA
jgi:hypothetical protein